MFQCALAFFPGVPRNFEKCLFIVQYACASFLVAPGASGHQIISFNELLLAFRTSQSALQDANWSSKVFLLGFWGYQWGLERWTFIVQCVLASFLRRPRGLERYTFIFQCILASFRGAPATFQRCTFIFQCTLASFLGAQGPLKDTSLSVKVISNVLLSNKYLSFRRALASFLGHQGGFEQWTHIF